MDGNGLTRGKNMNHDSTIVIVQALSSAIEEEITLDVGGQTLVGFASNRPALAVGDVVAVQFRLFTASDYGLIPINGDVAPSIEKVGGGFGYRIIGTLVEQGVSIGPVILQDESLSTDFAYLKGEKVSLEADRIEVRFIKA